MRKPNILIFMTDQLNGTLFPDGPAEWLHTPHLKRLAERSVRFSRAYTPSPLCAPARASFMTGQLPSATRVYDNAAEFSSELPTFAHHLRRAGYYTCLSGKMHFVGPDQLHGFEERLTTDIYPADFGWTPDYRAPDFRVDWWYHNLGSVSTAGIAEITNQLEYDDEVAAMASQKLYQLARGHDERPWCLTVSFTHPHDPYVARRRFWDLYDDCKHLDPEEGPIPPSDRDNHSLRILAACDHQNHPYSEDHVRRARRAYFANISYVDEIIGNLLSILSDTRLEQNTLVAFLSDHGDMIGEKGLWFKMSFQEGSCRVPLMISAPDLQPSQVDRPVSTMDAAPTFAEIAGSDMSEVSPWTEGESLFSGVNGNGGEGRPVLMEYAAEASLAPMVSVRAEGWKFNRCKTDPDQLFNLDKDPTEKCNLAQDANYGEVLARFASIVESRWDLEAFDRDVRESQARRIAINESLRLGMHFPWDYQPLQKAAERYQRNHKDLNKFDDEQRFPKGE